MNYTDYLKSKDWREKRKAKHSKKKRRCAICASEKNLDIHHLNYKNLFDVEQSDLRVLCRNCHFTSHRIFKEGKFAFKGTNHHSRFALLKTAVKKELGLTGKNMFYG